jgi:hypothetical protein
MWTDKWILGSIVLLALGGAGCGNESSSGPGDDSESEQPNDAGTGGDSGNSSTDCKSVSTAFVSALEDEVEVVFDPDSPGRCNAEVESTPSQCSCGMEVNGEFWGNQVPPINRPTPDACGVRSPRTGFWDASRSSMQPHIPGRREMLRSDVLLPRAGPNSSGRDRVPVTAAACGPSALTSADP